ncbi:MAG: metal-dependent hydrolase [Oceanococcaceae bacterium]
MAQSTQRAQHKEPIVVRENLDFGLGGDDIPRHWLAGNAYKTRMFDAVQATFPDGERYFIKSVRAFRDRITDPQLRNDVRDFMRQEGQHGMVHTEYNQRLQRQGINVEAFTKHTKAIEEKRLRRYSAEYNLALTASLEHFTAMMADLFFAERSMLADADDRVRAMFAWHAIEEMEHKAVAFDVMKSVAKVGYVKRCLAMTHATFSFSLYTLVAPWFMLRMDGYSPRECMAIYAKHMPWLFGKVLGRLLPMIARYYRPGFHPNDIPTVHNYMAWVESYQNNNDPLQAGAAMYSAAA